jgi:hypothetical protein
MDILVAHRYSAVNVEDMVPDVTEDHEFDHYTDPKCSCSGV